MQYKIKKLKDYIDNPVPEEPKYEEEYDLARDYIDKGKIWVEENYSSLDDLMTSDEAIDFLVDNKKINFDKLSNFYYTDENEVFTREELANYLDSFGLKKLDIEKISDLIISHQTNDCIHDAKRGRKPKKKPSIDFDYLLAEERKAVQDYRNAIAMTDDKNAIYVLSHILKEEAHHIELLENLRKGKVEFADSNNEKSLKE